MAHLFQQAQELKQQSKPDEFWVTPFTPKSYKGSRTRLSPQSPQGAVARCPAVGPVPEQSRAEQPPRASSGCPRTPPSMPGAARTAGPAFPAPPRLLPPAQTHRQCPLSAAIGEEAVRPGCPPCAGRSQRGAGGPGSTEAFSAPSSAQPSEVGAQRRRSERAAEPVGGGGARMWGYWDAGAPGCGRCGGGAEQSRGGGAGWMRLWLSRSAWPPASLPEEFGCGEQEGSRVSPRAGPAESASPPAAREAPGPAGPAVGRWCGRMSPRPRPRARREEAPAVPSQRPPLPRARGQSAGPRVLVFQKLKVASLVPFSLFLWRSCRNREEKEGGGGGKAL